MSTRIVQILLVCTMLVCLDACARRALERQLGDASANGNIQEIKRLLSLGADINCRDKSLNAWTPLIWALYEGHDDAAMVLLAAGADPNIKDANGRMALFFAENSGDHSAVIRALIRAGARTQQYKSMFESLRPDDTNRVAFETTTNAESKESQSVLDKPKYRQ